MLFQCIEDTWSVSVFVSGIKSEVDFFFIGIFSIVGMILAKLLFLLAGAFILGGQAGKLHSWQKSQAASASLLSESTSWGLSFQKEGERPVGNATINDLGKYHAYYAEVTNEKKIYLTFDAGSDQDCLK